MLCDFFSSFNLKQIGNQPFVTNKSRSLLDIIVIRGTDLLNADVCLADMHDVTDHQLKCKLKIKEPMEKVKFKSYRD